MLFPDLSRRHRQAELMDDPGLDPRARAGALRALEMVNRFSRVTSALWPSLSRLGRDDRGRPIRVLDLACGGGDVAVGLALRARREGVALTVDGCDVSPAAVASARSRAARCDVEVGLFCWDLEGGQPPPGYDAYVSCLFLHHLEGRRVRALLGAMAAGSARLILVSDLIRSRAGYLLSQIGPRLVSRSPIAWNDGPLSVLSSFTPEEVLRMAEGAGLEGARVRRCWPERYLLTWRRPTRAPTE